LRLSNGVGQFDAGLGRTGRLVWTLIGDFAPRVIAVGGGFIAENHGYMRVSEPPGVRV
jgi:hypothetical protein